MEKFKILKDCGTTDTVEGEIKTFKECPNEKFGITKISTGYWKAIHIRSGLVAVEGTSKAIVMKNLKEMFNYKSRIEHIHKVPSLSENIKQAKAKDLKFKRFRYLREEFRKVTGIDCPLCPITGGVDIIRLDSIVGTPDGISLRDYLKEKYGIKAQQIVEEMVEM